MYSFDSNLENDYEWKAVFISRSLSKLKKAIVNYYKKKTPKKEQAELVFNKDEWGSIVEKHGDVVGWVRKIKVIA